QSGSEPGETDDRLADGCGDAPVRIARKVRYRDARQLDVVNLPKVGVRVKKSKTGELQPKTGAAFDFGLALFFNARVEDIPIILRDLGGRGSRFDLALCLRRWDRGIFRRHNRAGVCWRA